MRKVMVVMRMRIRQHCTINLRDNLSVKTEKVSAVPLWQGSGPRLTSLVDSTFLSMKMTAWMLISSGPSLAQPDSYTSRGGGRESDKVLYIELSQRLVQGTTNQIASLVCGGISDCERRINMCTQ